MVQINDEVYAKLKKDADDNNQVVKIFRMIIIVLFILIFWFSFGVHWCDVQLEQTADFIQTEQAISKARANVKIREIESEGLTFEEYLAWLKVQEE